MTENDYLIGQLRAELELSAREEVQIHLLSSDFSYKGSKQGSVYQVAETLRPGLSKVWACEKLVEAGSVRPLFVSRTGPKLTFDDADPWPSLYAEEGDGWLDVKGAFIGPTEPYQLKSPKERARTLAMRGSA